MSARINNPKEKAILAFVHIEKTAGTTFIHLLRYNYFMRYLDVRPLSQKSNNVFNATDMKIVLRLNPFLECIGGHTVRPFSDLEDLIPQIRYITLLRDPIERYVSHYRYWVHNLGKSLDFEAFLNLEKPRNFQTKKIAGQENADLAMQILSKKFFLVGFVEQFNEYLILLQKKLQPFNFCPLYQLKNITQKRNEIEVLKNKYIKLIQNNNKLDTELYNFAKEELYSRYVDDYGPQFYKDVVNFERENISAKIPTLKQYVDYAYRKIYYEPISGGIRKLHGLPARGSYGF